VAVKSGIAADKIMRPHATIASLKFGGWGLGVEGFMGQETITIVAQNDLTFYTIYFPLIDNHSPGLSVGHHLQPRIST